MALIQHASIKLKNKIYGRKEEQTSVLTLDMSQVQALPFTFYPKGRKLRETRQTNVTSNEKKLYQGQGSSGSNIHNGIRQHQVMESRKEGPTTQTNTAIANSVWQGGRSEKSGR